MLHNCALSICSICLQRMSDWSFELWTHMSRTQKQSHCTSLHKYHKTTKVIYELSTNDIILRNDSFPFNSATNHFIKSTYLSKWNMLQMLIFSLKVATISYIYSQDWIVYVLHELHVSLNFLWKLIFWSELYICSFFCTVHNLICIMSNSCINCHLDQAAQIKQIESTFCIYLLNCKWIIAETGILKMW